MNRLTLPTALAAIGLLFLVAGCVIQVRPDGGLRIDLPPMLPVTLIGNTPNTVTDSGTIPVVAPVTATAVLVTTPVMTATAAPTATVTPTASLTATATGTVTATATITGTATTTATATVTATATITGTATATATATLTTTGTPPLTPTGTVTATGTTRPPGTPPTGTITPIGTPTPPTGTPLTGTPPATTQPGTLTPAPTGGVTPTPTTTPSRSATGTPTRPTGTPPGAPPIGTPTRAATTTVTTTPTSATPPATPTPIPGTVFLGSHRGYEADGTYTVVGEVINNVGYPVFNVKVIASFYDAGGALVGAQETVALLVRVGIELSSPFKLSIPSSGNIDRYELTLLWDDISIGEYEELTILSQDVRTNGQLEIVGELRNDGSVGVSNIIVVATFYDQSGAVVDVYQGTVSKPDLASDETTTYSIVVPVPDLDYERVTVQAQGVLVLF